MAKKTNFVDEIYGYALKNAIEFGKTDTSKVLPKLFQHGLNKKDVGKIIPKIQETVDKINSWDANLRNLQYGKYKKYIIEHEISERVGLPELPNVKGKPVFRVAPFPSGALHLGNARTFLLNAMYAEKYNGKVILVMDDTIGSAKKPITPEAYGLIKDALKWLGVEYDKKIIYKSDRLEIYYKYAKELIKKDKAYVCHCPQKWLQQLRVQGKECGCRQFPVSIQLLRWEAMFDAKEGEATLRLKTDMKHPNPAFRDRVLFKVSQREHPRKKNKYRVWPALEMSWAIDDHLLGITHIIRGNDLSIESEMEKYIWDIFGWTHPIIVHLGLVNVDTSEAKMSKSKAQREVQSGKFIGWDDPRTWSVQSLMRRGILKEAVREFVREIGITKQDVTIPIDSLYAANRRMIDAHALRYFFVENGRKIEVDGKPEFIEVGIPVHPEKDERRVVRVDKSIYISKEDFDKYQGEEVRLLHLYNINLGKESEVTSVENKDIPKIQWVSDSVSASVMMPSGKMAMGLAESGVKKLKKGDLIQFERFGFVRFDGKNKDGTYEFWFAHK